MRIITCTLLLLAILCVLPAYAQTSDNPLHLIPFVLPWDDASTGVTDASVLLDKPAGKHGFVQVKNGHLYAGDARIRFFGVNIVSSACFPTHGDAEIIAARLAKFGINCVRFHHMDCGWDKALLQDDRRTLDPAQLDSLDYFIAQLKQHGIYADLNLHVSRNYPDMPTWDGKPEFDKGLDNFYPPMIDMQKEYARDLLTHYNPYTKARYCDEPAVAFVEINNENGLLSTWNWYGLDQMPDAYRLSLQTQWNAWLKTKYSSNENLKKAWEVHAEPLGAEMLSNGDFSLGDNGWSLEQHETARGILDVESSGAAGPNTLRVRVDNPSATGWHIQLTQNGLSVRKGKLYTLTFNARADTERSVMVGITQAHDPWRGIWTTGDNFTPSWHRYAYYFIAPDDENNARIVLSNLAIKTGTVWLSNVSLKPGAPNGICPTPPLGEIPLYKKSLSSPISEVLQDDWNHFLWETEEHYWTGMNRYLKDDLGVKAVVVGTASGYSPSLMQASLDAVDAHAYWHHPQFPGKAWDPKNWFITNEPMAGIAGGGTLPGLAGWRIAGKPFLVTEYNHPAPNTYASEAFLLLAAYGALQDWDALFAFDYQGSRAAYDVKRIPGFFDIDEHPTKMATIPAASYLFLRGDVHPPQAMKVVPATREQAIAAIENGSVWNDNSGAFGLDPLAALRYPIAIDLNAKTAVKPEIEKLNPAAPIGSANGELQWIPGADGAHGLVTVDTARSKAVIGATGTYHLAAW